MATTTIEWATKTWNPVTGCTEVSPGCDHCYAHVMANRLQAMGQAHYVNGFEVALHEDFLGLPMLWKKPQMVFVNSMSDLLHQDVPDDFIIAVFKTMALAHQHIYQVLTKRPSRLVNTKLLTKIQSAIGAWPSNIWMGVSVESMAYTWRIEKLKHVPAPIRFVSAEPLLGPLDLSDHLTCCPSCGYPYPHRFADSCGYCEAFPDVRGIAWVIAGCESGHGARPMDEDWVRAIRDLCIERGTRFFYKQKLDARGHKVPLPELDGKVWNEFPEIEKAVLL